jgi:rhamnopyranosyl-N-acetylglucosaminyl-diphospho-decaprenol beta-1,3/1,4-galactofuranosyltransferase
LAPSEIIVIDNGSTDGTAEWLASQRDLSVIHQKNLGSAGGQSAGADFAFGQGQDFIWMMDDDGDPDAKCLEELIRIRTLTRIDVVSPLVYENSLNERIRFIPTNKKAEGFAHCSCSDLRRRFDSLFPYGISAFHGLLVPQYVFEDIGNVRREMFIWGEEYDFVLRIAKRYSCGIVTSALFRHPIGKKAMTVWNCRYLQYYEVPDKVLFHYVRNQFYIRKRYFSYKSACFFLATQLLTHILHSLHQKNTSSLRTVCRALRESIAGQWSPYC